jgi:hypothetical protein
MPAPRQSTVCVAGYLRWLALSVLIVNVGCGGAGGTARTPHPDRGDDDGDGRPDEPAPDPEGAVVQSRPGQPCGTIDGVPHACHNLACCAGRCENPVPDADGRAVCAAFPWDRGWQPGAPPCVGGGRPVLHRQVPLPPGCPRTGVAASLEELERQLSAGCDAPERVQILRGLDWSRSRVLFAVTPVERYGGPLAVNVVDTGSAVRVFMPGPPCTGVAPPPPTPVAIVIPASPAPVDETSCPSSPCLAP